VERIFGGPLYEVSRCILFPLEAFYFWLFSLKMDERYTFLSLREMGHKISLYVKLSLDTGCRIEEKRNRISYIGGL